MRNLLIAVFFFISATSLAQEVTSKVTFTKRVAFKDSVLIPASAAAGKVFTSDANGYGTWQTNPGTTAWSLTGNAGTNPAIDFIGTTDTDSLYIKVHNERVAFFDNMYSSTAIGYHSFINGGGNENIALGINTLKINNGDLNLAIGSGSMESAQNCNNNIAIGAGSLNQSYGAGSNIAIGLWNSYFVNGFNNISLGNYANTHNINGVYNIAIGDSSLGRISDGNYNVSIGRSGQADSVYHAIGLGFRHRLYSYMFSIDDSIQAVKFSLNSGLSGSVLTNDGTGIGIWQTPRFVSSDSATIYALAPDNGTTYYCTNCTGDGITGRIVSYIAGAWRRLKFD